MDFKWKPFPLYMELLPCTDEYHLFVDDFYFLELRGAPARSSVAGLLHHVSVLWSISQARFWLMAPERIVVPLDAADPWKVAVASLGRPVFYFFLLLTFFLVFFKGFRQFL